MLRMESFECWQLETNSEWEVVEQKGCRGRFYWILVIKKLRDHS